MLVVWGSSTSRQDQHSALKGLADGLDTETGKEVEIQDNLQGFGLQMKDNIERRADVSEG